MLTLFDAHRDAPSAPVLTFYDEARGFRMDFSALTLDNWAAKMGNFLIDELDLSPGESIAVDVDSSWHRLVLLLGAAAAQLTVADAADPESEVLFQDSTRLDSAEERELIAVTIDGFGRSAAECGINIGEALDLGAEVRLHGDHFPHPTQPLAQLYPEGTAARILLRGEDPAADDRALAAIGAGGSAVVVAGGAPAERLAEIAAAEKALLDSPEAP
ncbi:MULTISPECIES: TIGR03089 family protein [Corynebacterium]|uniref:TIGR03089 family protein n=1 Tax=Corynebacterium TaxID=1716 RepID=UPI00124F0645|nr:MULTISPECIES: TIGR03089 family protein [Corynebacterium]